MWTCCSRHASKEGCKSEEHHRIKQYAPGTGPEVQWAYHHTPATSTTQPRPLFRAAVAIDCEMGINTDNDTELIRVTLIDYFNGEVLIDSLVYPEVPVKHYNTRYSGVTRSAMETALQQDQCIRGKTAARQMVWQFVGPETVVVGPSQRGGLVLVGEGPARRGCRGGGRGSGGR
jgi:RNA exonuclease 1